MGLTISLSKINGFFAAIRILEILDNSAQGRISDALASGDTGRIRSTIVASANQFFDDPNERKMYLQVIFTTAFFELLIGVIREFTGKGGTFTLSNPLSG